MPDLFGLTNWTNKFIFNPLLVYKGGPRINPVGSKQRHDPKNMIIIKKRKLVSDLDPVFFLFFQENKKIQVRRDLGSVGQCNESPA